QSHISKARRPYIL
uniref:Neurotensin n=2 Tax=Rana temporaria TaxID=8407 RepID=NEUT_RANTE|nr:RecName: Full=Neurotensin; Short=NT [Rana temporaria]